MDSRRPKLRESDEPSSLVPIGKLHPAAFGEQLSAAMSNAFLGQGIGQMYEALASAGTDVLVVDPEPAEREPRDRFGSVTERLEAWPA